MRARAQAAKHCCAELRRTGCQGLLRLDGGARMAPRHLDPGNRPRDHPRRLVDHRTPGARPPPLKHSTRAIARPPLPPDGFQFAQHHGRGALLGCTPAAPAQVRQCRPRSGTGTACSPPAAAKPACRPECRHAALVLGHRDRRRPISSISCARSACLSQTPWSTLFTTAWSQQSRGPAPLSVSTNISALSLSILPPPSAQPEAAGSDAAPDTGRATLDSA